MKWDVFAKRHFVTSFTHVGLFTSSLEFGKFIEKVIEERRFDSVRVFCGIHGDLIIEMKITQLL